MKKKLLSLYAAFVMTLTIVLSSFTGFSAYAFDNSAREGVVAVVFYVKDATTGVVVGSQFIPTKELGDIELSGGSGFFVGKDGEDPQYIVTNHHVVDDYINANEGETFIYDMHDTYEGFPVVLYATSCELRIYYSEDDYDVAYVDCYGDREKVDLAVLRLRNATDKRHSLKIKSATDDMVGDTVYTVGFPGNADNVLTGASKYGVEDVTVHKGSINKLVVNDGKGVERLAIDATIQHGNSGGPLVDEDGNVLGVNTDSVSTSTEEIDYYAISSNEVIRFLDKNNIPYEMADGAKKRSNTEKDDDSDSNVGIIMGIVVAVAAVAAAGIVIFIKKKGKGGNAPAKGKNAAKKGIMRSMSVQHGGKTYPVGKAPVMIGRDAAGCSVVYKEGTPGVSGKHCTVSFDPASGEFILTDLKSSFGTFLGKNGQKIAPNTPIKLKPGETFYVGDKANVISVELEK